MADFTAALDFDNHQHAFRLYHQINLASLAISRCALAIRGRRQHKGIVQTKHGKEHLEVAQDKVLELMSEH